MTTLIKTPCRSDWDSVFDADGLLVCKCESDRDFFGDVARAKLVAACLNAKLSEDHDP